MKWQKKGLIKPPNLGQGWSQTHAMVPTPILLGEKIRVYINSCDEHRVARVGYVDLLASDPSEVIGYSKTPVLDIGEPGTFDQDGVLQCSIIQESENKLLMYYVGFEVENKIRYRLLSGLAISEDAGESFIRIQKTPILERSPGELFFRGGPFAIKEADKYKLWYVAGSEWIDIEGKQMPVYVLKYQESKSPDQWQDLGETSIDIEFDNEFGFGRPYYFKHAGKSYLFYSIRDKKEGYVIGYAESDDGKAWIRKDNEIGISKSTGEFDSEMICYAALIEVKNKVYMFYNGNDFGRDGFAYAELLEW